MEYKYCNRDLLEKPEKYNFSEYNGEEFVQAYFRFRIEKVEEIKNNIKKEKNIDEIIDEIIQKNEKIEDKKLEKILIGILKEKKNDIHRSNSDIDKFLKKYEVKKRLIIDETKKLETNIQDYGKIINYLFLDLLCVIRYNERKNLRFLNLILKVNDMLLTQYAKMNSDDEFSILKYCLENEVKFILELSKQKNIDIK
tara:strand:+ start:262 stop:852 length:591 start_codon:yes stop_codon:yes gene_type:complete